LVYWISLLPPKCLARAFSLQKARYHVGTRHESICADMLTQEFGYTEITAPFMVNEAAAYGVGQMPKFAEDMFKTNTGHYLIPTSEVSVTNLAMDEIFDPKQLPLRYTSYSPCFRSEAGSAGKDTRGMIRVHQFSKVEQVVICTPEQSQAEHERMTSLAEEFLKPPEAAAS
jgi:seryl-tRNA synthetase